MTLRPTDSSVLVTSPSGRKYVQGACSRAVWYRLNKVAETNPYSAKAPWIWWLGKAWESQVQKLLKEKGILCVDNPRFVCDMGEYLLHGEMDGIGIDTSTTPAEHFVIELKNTGGYYAKMSLLGSVKKYQPKPKVENMLQLMVYLDRGREDLKYGVLLYLIRDDMDRVAFYIKLEDHQGEVYPRVWAHSPTNGPGELLLDYPMSAIYTRYNQLIAAHKAKTSPEKEYSLRYSEEQCIQLLADGVLSKKQVDEHLSGKTPQGDWNCRFCSYMDHCYQQ